MKCPVESPDLNSSSASNEFAEFMWMAEEDVEEFDKRYEQELLEEIRLHQAMDAFDDHVQAAYYAEQGLQPPRSRGGRHISHYSQGATGNRNGSNNSYNDNWNTVDDDKMVHEYHDPVAENNRNLAAASTLNPNAPAFVLNPNAPVFVPSWEANKNMPNDGVSNHASVAEDSQIKDTSLHDDEIEAQR